MDEGRVRMAVGRDKHLIKVLDKCGCDLCSREIWYKYQHLQTLEWVLSSDKKKKIEVK